MPSRRRFLLTAAAAALAAPALTAAPAEWDRQVASLPPGLAPALVTLTPAPPAGEIHVVPDDYSLYWTLPGGQAIRYFVGVGQDALYESGTFTVGAKKEWPSWTPTQDMIRRSPGRYAQYAGGMPGGPGNPLGARALYLFTAGQGDTFLRIHGTAEPETIGQSVSNGCARLVDTQMIDLYQRVPLETVVVLYPKNIAPPFRVLRDEAPVFARGGDGEPPVTSGSALAPAVEVAPLDDGAVLIGDDALVERLNGVLDGIGGGIGGGVDRRF